VSLGNGFYVVIFDPENVEYVKESGQVFKVQSLSYGVIKQKVELNPEDVTHNDLD
jgi:hypothetical protein